jgi:hypothetical protein
VKVRKDGIRINKRPSKGRRKLVVRSTVFPHRNIHTSTWTSPDGKAHIQIDHVLIKR